MLKIYLPDDLEQKSPEWHDLRNKYPFTSSMAQAIGNAGKGLESLIWEKLTERYSSGERVEFTNPHLERGNELEPQAISEYELETGENVDLISFVTNTDVHELAGASTDGLVNSDGVIEAKAYNDKKYLMLLRELKKKGSITIESVYLWQMEMELMLTAREWVDFVVYNPNFKKNIIIQRVYSDPVKREKLMIGLTKGAKLLAEYESDLKHLK